jgi:hypothetical protein
MANQFTDGVDVVPGVTAPTDWVNYTTLKVAVGRFLGYSPTEGNWTAGELADVDAYVQAGVRQFYYPPAMEGVEPGWDWSFMRPTTTLATTADDAAQDLPSSLGRVMGDFYYDEADYRRSVVQVSEAKILASLSRSEDTGPPQIACVRFKDQVSGSAQVVEVAWWPIPDDAYTLTYRYEARSGKLTGVSPYPLGAQRYAELITESCLAIAEQRGNDEAGLHTAAFHALLLAGIALDRKQGARHFGPMGGAREVVIPRHGDTGSTYPITYDGSPV